MWWQDHNETMKHCLFLHQYYWFIIKLGNYVVYNIVDRSNINKIAICFEWRQHGNLVPSWTFFSLSLITLPKECKIFIFYHLSPFLEKKSFQTITRKLHPHVWEAKKARYIWVDPKGTGLFFDFQAWGTLFIDLSFSGMVRVVKPCILVVCWNLRNKKNFAYDDTILPVTSSRD